MHSDVVADKPGRCPECGMDLVVESELKKKPRIHVANSATSASLRPITWKSYIPLMVIFLVLLAATVAASWSDSVNGTFSIENPIAYFMAGFFLVFAGFKLIDLKGFAEGYSTYDLLAIRWRGYAFIYPFIELAFGLTMLAGYHPEWLLWIEFAVMAFSGLGVSIKLLKRETFQCVCLGTLLKVPLTYVTLLEDFGMAFLALILILI
jgi:hypothetical protein